MLAGLAPRETSKGLGGLHETIGRLLGFAAPGAAVADLGAERVRRGL
jgi:hypothetical protein